MLDNFPPSMNEGLGRYILYTLEMLAAVSLACIAVAVVFGVVAYRSAGRRRIVWTWLAIGSDCWRWDRPGSCSTW